MTKTIINNNNVIAFGRVKNGEFFTDSENHFCYKVSDCQILDFTLNEFFDTNETGDCYYDDDDFVTVHKTIAINIIM